MANYFNETASISKLASIEVSTRGTNTHIGKFSVIDDFVKIKHVGGKGDIFIGDYVLQLKNIQNQLNVLQKIIQGLVNFFKGR